MKIVPMSVELVDSMGSDDSVANAARVSMNKSAEQYTPEQNIKLLNYLAKHAHWSPFAHCFISFRIKVPIFVAMQLDKHTVGLVTNSVSRRYVDEEPEFYFPDVWRGRAENVKQGSSDEVIPYTYSDNQQDCVSVQDVLLTCVNMYNNMIDFGVAPEQARMVLPQNMMTERIWSGSLAAFSRVCALRLDPHSQKEIQELAGMVAALVEPLFPNSWKALQQ